MPYLNFYEALSRRDHSVGDERVDGSRGRRGERRNGNVELPKAVGEVHLSRLKGKGQGGIGR